MITKRALIVTVGTGNRADVYIVKPLVKTICDSRPDYLVLVVSRESRVHAEAIIKVLKLDKSSYSFESVDDIDDFQSIFRKINQIFQKLDSMGFSPKNVQLDFTSGTKAMSSGAVLAAIYSQCESVKYITGERKNGVVIDGTEKFLTVNPSAVFSLHDIRLAHELVLRLRFATADEILSGLQRDLLNEDELNWAKNLRQVSQAYGAWDRFDHRGALRKTRKISWESTDIQKFKPLPEAFEFLEKLAENSNCKEWLLYDLFNNAVRRGIEGKYDDAVARLYRAAELFAQQLLEYHPNKINSADVDLSKIPESMRDELERLRNDLDGKIRIGMEMDYKVLHALKEPFGNRFLEDQQLRGRLGERNRSILAHGLEPVSKSLYSKLRQSLLSLFETKYSNFREAVQKLQFPWIGIGQLDH